MSFLFWWGTPTLLIVSYHDQHVLNCYFPFLNIPRVQLKGTIQHHVRQKVGDDPEGSRHAAPPGRHHPHPRQRRGPRGDPRCVAELP